MGAANSLLLSGRPPLTALTALLTPRAEALRACVKIKDPTHGSCELGTV
jgi:hypothetical protein